ncbi:MAG: cation transporter [Solirubrobacterales bacterium]|jgi:cation diffusion facilitator family transporter|nr:cation transporter [Solirubrobacterales bacterium]
MSVVLPPVPLDGPAPGARSGAAALSIVSNSVLILLKVIAGTVTGSVALLTEALHSVFDLVASVVAFVSVRKADEPADDDHPYGHEKFEDMAAAIEGMLILVGSGVIVFESVRRLVVGGEVHALGFGMAVLAISIAVNVVVSARLSARARETGSPALEADAAHLRTDALTSGGVLIGLALVQITGEAWLDPVVALLVAVSIVVAGVRILRSSSRVLIDEALPAAELAAIGDEVLGFGHRGVAGFHKLRARRAGARRYVDMHVQFRAGTSLEDAHETSHALQDAIRSRVQGADVLIHLEPEDRVVPGTEVPAVAPGRRGPLSGG